MEMKYMNFEASPQVNKMKLIVLETQENNRYGCSLKMKQRDESN